MSSRFRKRLPLVAVIGALVALGCMIASTAGRQSTLADTGETRRVVETTTLARLQALHPDSIDDPAFREAVVQAKDDPYVATVWLIAPDGRIGRDTATVDFDRTTVGLKGSDEHIDRGGLARSIGSQKPEYLA